MDFQQPLSFRSETHPMVVGVVDSEQDFKSIFSEKPACDILEIRLDCLGINLLEENALPLPALITCRRADEGGSGSLPDGRRSEIIEDALRYASAADIEVRSLEALEKTVELCRSSGVPVIASAHDFENVPPDSELEETVQRAIGGGASVCKIAATPGSLRDVCRLAELLEPGRFTIPLSVMGMGRFGRASRLLFAQAGSVLNYGYLTRANVPGQWPAEQLRKLLDGGDL
ncbi:type I 3-dehydroquinate dehydratase [Verrucomicrobiales bacterium]|nr:type I 3-dehydroquinate dehydratase [Verrucomicrobiales bacterium]